MKPNQIHSSCRLSLWALKSIHELNFLTNYNSSPSKPVLDELNAISIFIIIN